MNRLNPVQEVLERVFCDCTGNVSENRTIGQGAGTGSYWYPTIKYQCGLVVRHAEGLGEGSL